MLMSTTDTQPLMRAAWYERKGAAREVLQVGELPIPDPGPGEVRVHVVVSGINPSDTKGRAGWRGQTDMPFPRIIPHQDGAGVIDAVGAGVPTSRVGERVWIYEAQRGRAFGTGAQHVVVPSTNAVRLPERVSYNNAACVGVTAWICHRWYLGDWSIAG